MRKSIFEILNTKGNVNLQKEIDNIDWMIRSLYISNVGSLDDIIDEKIVKDWKYSQRSLDLNDLLEKLEIRKQDLHIVNYDLEHSLRYIELMYNLVMVATECLYRYGFEFEEPKEFERLKNNITYTNPKYGDRENFCRHY